jgi:ribosomal protein L16 Arg81 hydroxylase
MHPGCHRKVGGPVFDDVTSTFEVPRVERPSRREFEERFLFPQRPVIISGAMEGWPVRERWTNDYLTEKVGARNVDIRNPKKKIVNAPPMKLAEYIDLLARGAISDGQLYASNVPIRSALPELWPDVRFPPFVDEDKYSDVNLWFGPGNNFTPLHYDPGNNFLTQVRGRKQMILCPPREITRLYPFPFSYADNPYSYAANHVSQVDVLSPDLTRFPGWAHADRALLELGPGDMLFIPVYWWHAVWGIDQNMSVNYWWGARPGNLLQHPRQTIALIEKMFAKHSKAATLRARGLVRRSAGSGSAPTPADRDNLAPVRELPIH